ncbi:MAG: hypothetical protein WCQ80_01150 [Bacilli bacterium]
MKLLVLVLNKVECLEKMLKEFASNNISGATIISSTGMVHELMNSEDIGIIGSFRHFLNSQRKENKTIFMVVHEEKIPQVYQAIERTVGSLDLPDTGVIFTLSVDDFKGFKY